MAVRRLAGGVDLWTGARPTDLPDATSIPGPGLVKWQRPAADGQVMRDLALYAA
jgi:hypothetical protein